MQMSSQHAAGSTPLSEHINPAVCLRSGQADRRECMQTVKTNVSEQKKRYVLNHGFVLDCLFVLSKQYLSTDSRGCLLYPT